MTVRVPAGMPIPAARMPAGEEIVEAQVGVVRRVEFRALGKPEPQGSTRARIPRGWTRPIVTSDNPNLKQWRSMVAASVPAQTSLMQGPVSVSLVFDLARPRSLPKRVIAHLKKPDTDKLIRAMLDALTGVLWRDDSQVVEVIARKRYAAGSVGVFVVVEELADR